MTVTRDTVIEQARRAGERLAQRGQERTRGLMAGARVASPAGAVEFAAPSLERLAGGLVVGIGDSWLDYFLNDILNQLQLSGFDCRDVARAASTLAEIAYTTGGQLDKLAVLLQQLPAGTRPAAIVLSGGGNDVVGTDGVVLATLLNHRESGLPALIGSQANAVVEVQLRSALVTTLTQITAHCQAFLGAAVPIVLHGYGNPVPDGEYLHFPRRGPWLKPAFAAKGWTDLEANKAVMKTLIDGLNVMQRDTLTDPAFAHVKHVDVRPVLSSGDDYKLYWTNELHPTRVGFAAVSELIAAAL